MEVIMQQVSCSTLHSAERSVQKNCCTEASDTLKAFACTNLHLLCMPAAVEPHPAAKTGGVARWWRNKFSSKKTRKSTPSYTTLQVQPRGTLHLYLQPSLDMKHAFDDAHK